jgi:hypothetical protein
MGRYDDAMLHFKRMIEKVISEDHQSINDCEGYILEIIRWMSEVDEMCSVDLGAECKT